MQPILQSPKQYGIHLHLSGALLSVCLSLAALAAPMSAHSADTKPKPARQATEHPAKKKGSTKVKHQRSSSEESTAERDRRLYRECRGAPNAGACLGYARQ